MAAADYEVACAGTRQILGDLFVHGLPTAGEHHGRHAWNYVEGRFPGRRLQPKPMRSAQRLSVIRIQLPRRLAERKLRKLPVILDVVELVAQIEDRLHELDMGGSSR